MASVGVLVFCLAGCGGGSHTASTAAVETNIAGRADATTGTNSANGAQPDTKTSGATDSSTPTKSGHVGVVGSGTSASSGGAATTKGSSSDPVPGHNGSSTGKGVSHGKSKKAAGKKVAGKPAASTGSAGDSTSSPPNAYTGVPYEVTTTSMEPTFQPETKIYYDPASTRPQIGEVVVFYLPAGAEEGSCGEVMVGGRACAKPLPGMTKNKEISFKRVVGLPGDSIAIHEGHVIRNGQPEQPEPPILPCEKDERLNCEFPTPIIVPAGYYYLMADNRGLYKEDSRLFGPVPQEYILGTVEGS